MGHSYVGSDDVQTYDPFYANAFWKLKFAWFPKRCDISNERIWFKTAYLGTMMITGPGTPVFEYRWLTKKDFIVAALKGTIR